jgi:hypothetical protein
VANDDLQDVLDDLGAQIAAGGYSVVVALDDGDSTNPADDGTRLVTVEHMGAFSLALTIEPAVTGAEPAGRAAITDDRPSFAFAYVAGSNRDVTVPDSLDVTIADNDAPGVLILQSGESTDVIEPTDTYFVGSGFLSQLTSAIVELKGAVAVGQTWTIQLTVQNSTQGAPPVNYLVGVTTDATTDTLVEIAALLADRINDFTAVFSATSSIDQFVLVEGTSAFTLVLKVSSGTAVFDYVATAEQVTGGTDLTVKNLAFYNQFIGFTSAFTVAGAPAFTTTTITAGANTIGTHTIHLTGTPVLGNTWSVTLTAGSEVRTYSHVVSDADGTLDTLAEVAQSLAAQINAGVPMLGTLASLRLIGDFGTSVAREVGIHDSVFFAQNLDDAKWNANSNSDIFFATTVPHLTVLGTGDGNPDFYAFEIKDDMIADALAAWTSPAGVLLGHTTANFPGLQVIFDIDGGFVPGDGSVWQSVLNLWELKAPLDPNQPTLPNQIASGWLAADPGSFSGLDGLLAHYIQVPGVYYL